MYISTAGAHDAKTTTTTIIIIIINPVDLHAALKHHRRGSIPLICPTDRVIRHREQIIALFEFLMQLGSRSAHIMIAVNEAHA